MRDQLMLPLAVLVMLHLTSHAAAQTPINAPGAMQPSTGTGVGAHNAHVPA